MRTSLLVRSSAALLATGIVLSGCSSDGDEKVASPVSAEATDDATDESTDEPTEDSDDDSTEDATDEATEDSTDDADDSGDGSVDGTQVIDVDGSDKDLTLEIPTGWQPSDAMDSSPFIIFVAVSPEVYEAFSPNVVVTVEDVPSGASEDDIFANHTAAALSLDSTEPDGSTGTVGGYPSHTVSGLREGPSGEQLAQSSTLVIVEGDDGSTVALALALTTHADDSAGRDVLSGVLSSATIS